jgi:Holliday junction resolvase RusA-like endonuclease
MTKKEDYIIIELPMWPSINWLFATITKDRYWRYLKKPRRSKSEAYTTRIEVAEREFNKIPTKYKITWDSWLEVHLNYFFSLYTKEWKKRIKDTCNYEKATMDFLSDQIEWLEDHKLKRVIQEKHDSEQNIVKILIKEIK